MSKEDGGPAFPGAQQKFVSSGHGGTIELFRGDVPSGMTLRDYFAAAALTGLLGTIATTEGALPGAAGRAIKCEVAYEYADKMLEARKK